MAPADGGSPKGPAPNLGAWLNGKNDLRILPYFLPEKLGEHSARFYFAFPSVPVSTTDGNYLDHPYLEKSSVFF